MSGDRGGNLFGITPKPKRQASPPLPNGAVQRLIGVWVALFEAKFHEKPIIMPKDGAALKRLIAHAGVAAVERRLSLYLALDDAYVSGEGYPLALLQANWNKLIVADHAPTGRIPGVEETDKYLEEMRSRRSRSNGVIRSVR